MDFHATRKIVHSCVNEFYQLKKGGLIFEPKKAFLFCDVIIGRQAIKHVIEQRKAEKIFSESEMGIIIILDKLDQTGRRAFITAFYCRPERIVLMQKKKPQ
jgi:hypothetical protein